jgi:hypothetical protein
MIREIPVGKTAVGLIDLRDFDRVQQHPWHVLCAKDGTVKYARSSIKAPGSDRHRTVLLHRFILGIDGPEIVDHINGDGLDNRRCNLRIATAQQNATNRSPKGSSKLNGVRRVGYRHLASIAPNGVEIYLGLYDTAQEAAAVYNAAALIAYGEFARLNPGATAADALALVLAEKQKTAHRLLEEVAQLTRRG